jgi:diguanylate cyclase (GGDEF)-like protein/PAS domain S-box-containing protein
MVGFHSLRIPKGLRFIGITGWLVAVTLLWTSNSVVVASESPAKKILYLNSYHQGYRWSDDISSAIKQVFKSEKDKSRLFIEYLDTKRRQPGNMAAQARQYLHAKYPQDFFDLILCSDDAAFNFLLDSRKALFGSTPVVFCGVNYLDRGLLKGQQGMVGISEEAEITDTLDVALSLHPDTRQIFVVSDRTQTGLKILKKIEELQPLYRHKVSFDILPDTSALDLAIRLRQIPSQSLVLFCLFSRDAAGQFYEYDEVLPTLVENCPAPIYGVWDFNLGQGMVGGKLLTGYMQGQQVAHMGLKILHGVSPDSLPAVTVTKGQYAFDMRQLERFGIDVDRLPSPSTIINQEHPLSIRYRLILFESLSAILVLLGVIFLLLRIIQHRKRLQARLENATTQLEKEVRARTEHLSGANRQLRMEILQRNQSARALKESEQEKTLILNSSSDLITYLDTEFRIRWANRKSHELAGLHPGDVQGQYCYEVWHGLDAPCIGCPVVRAGKSGLPQHGEVVTSDGKIWLVRAFPFHDGQGRVTGFASFSLDVTEQKQAQRAIHRMAYYDHLTGLPNRALFQKELDRRLEDAVGRDHGLALMFLDLDHFKGVNDSLGHAKGDLLLQRIAERLQNCLGKEDTLARLNGDEFIFLLTEVDDPEAVMAIAGHVQRIMAQPFDLDGDEIYVGTSIGIACYPLHGVDASNLIKRADRALYAAKERGRNAIELFSEQINARFHRRHQLESRLQRALMKDEFFLEYQPQVDLRSGQVIGVEALLRWKNHDLGLVMPEDFIPLAEETGLIRPIGEWVLRTACREYLSWGNISSMPVHLSVNISGQQIKHPDFLPMIDDVLKTTGFDPQLLELEITESVAMDDVEANIRTFRELKRRRVQLAIDDFGTGYSSLSYLRHFPIDRLKIDRKFIRDVAECRDSASLVEAIIGMARSLYLDIIAEGVETSAQVEYLWRHGCLQAQGYFFGRPMSPESLMELLQKQDFSDMVVSLPVI